MDVDRAVEELITSPPAIHYGRGEFQSWGLHPDALRWLANQVASSRRTLETGCGVSTVLFALKSSAHTVISPTKWQHDSVRKWCTERGFSTDHVEFVVAQSQHVLPTLPADPLDLALIDGSHVFPIPLIDWYYTATRLRVGGFVVVDDMHIPACQVLRDFLHSEEGRWRQVSEVGRAAVFEKVDAELFAPGGWKAQPFNHWTDAAAAVTPGKGLRARLRRAKPRMLG